MAFCDIQMIDNNQNSIVDEFKRNLKGEIELRKTEYWTKKNECEISLRDNLRRLLDNDDLDLQQVREIGKLYQEYEQTIGKPCFVPTFSNWSQEFLLSTLPSLEYSYLEDSNLVEYGKISESCLTQLKQRIKWWLTKLDASMTFSEEILDLKNLQDTNCNEAFVRILLNEILMEVLEILPKCELKVEDRIRQQFEEKGTPGGILDYSFYLTEENGSRRFLGLMEAKRGNSIYLEQARIQSTVQLITKVCLEADADKKSFFAIASTGYKFCFILMTRSSINVSRFYSVTSNADLILIVSIIRGLLLATAQSLHV